MLYFHCKSGQKKTLFFLNIADTTLSLRIEHLLVGQLPHGRRHVPRRQGQVPGDHGGVWQAGPAVRRPHRDHLEEALWQKQVQQRPEDLLLLGRLGPEAGGQGEGVQLRVEQVGQVLHAVHGQENKLS